MPFNPTQMQLALGTGGVSRLGGTAAFNPMATALSPAGGAVSGNVGGMAPGGTNVGVTPQVPAGVDPAWSRIFGSATPTTLLAQRTASGGVSPSPAAQPSAPTSAGPSPQQAGTINAMVPGANSEANPNNGFSLEKQAGGLSNAEKGKDSAAPAPQSAVPNVQPPAPQQQTTVPNVAMKSVMAPQTETKAATATTSAPQGSGQFANVRAAPIWNLIQQQGVSPAQVPAFLRQHGWTQDASGVWVQSPLRGTPWADMNAPMTPVATPGAVDPSMTPAQINALTGGNQTLNDLVGRALRLYSQLNQAPDVGGTTPGPTADDLNNYNILSNYLKSLGITLGAGSAVPGPDQPGQSAPPAGGGGGHPVDQLPPNQLPQPGVPNPPQTSPTDTYQQPPAPPPDTVVTDPSGDQGGGPAYPGTNLDLSNVTGDQFYRNSGMAGLLADLYKTYGDKAPAIFEMIQSGAQQQNLQNNRQNAVNSYGGRMADYQNSPLFTGIQDLSTSILNNPTTIPWDIVRNQAVGSVDKSMEAARQALGSSAGRRGLSTGAVAGMAADIGRQQQDETAKTLGSYEIQKAQTDRQMQLQALQAALGGFAGTSGFDMSNASNLANLIAGNPSEYGNYASGLGSAFMNIDATQSAIDQANQQGKLTWEDAFNAFMGTAGKVGSAMLGKPA